MKSTRHLAATHSRMGAAALIGAAAAAWLLWTGAAYSQSRYAFPDTGRIVVIGDVHGAYDAMVGILETTGIVDADGNWTGGDARLVSLGDLLDRGADSRAVLDLLMQLQQSAPAAGGRVHVVLGNHEHMNMIGDLRYVSPGEYAAFAPDETAAMRDEAFAEWLTEQQSSAGQQVPAGQPDPAAATREQFDLRYPPGYFAHRAAFAPDGQYGAWLIDLPAIIVIGDTAFLHGGLSSLVADLGLDSTNERVHDELVEYLSLRDMLAAAGALPAFDMQDDLSIAQRFLAAAEDSASGADSANETDDADSTAAPGAAPVTPPPGMARFFAIGTEGVGAALTGPLWYRGSVYCKPVLERPVLDAALDALGAARVVVGHTTTDNRRAQVRHGGRLVMLDTGMLTSYYHGTPAAMIIDDGQIAVQYLGDSQPVPVDLTVIQDGYGLTEAELIDALMHGEVVSKTGEADAGAMQLVLEFGGARLNAIFVPDDGGGALELAAATLDDLIGAEMIAPTVRRDIDGAAGTLQLVYADSASEAQRLAANRGFSGFCPIEPQLHLMYAFDALIENAGRSADNILFINDISQVLLTGHTRAFGTSRSLPSGLDATALQIPAVVVEGLRMLDEETLETDLAGLLDRRQIRALLSRRDRLIEGRRPRD